MQKIIYTNGKIEVVENNTAHSLIEKGLARLATKEMEKPPRNKMMSKKRRIKTK